MSNETFITVIGRLVADPELRYTQGGAGVANFTVASNARTFDKNTNEWKNKTATFWRCAAWNQGEKQRLGENVADALKKGDSVIVRGEIETREWEDKDGGKRSVIELRVDTIGKDLRWHQPAAGNGSGHAAQPSGFGPSTAQSDPWANNSPANAGGWGNGPAASEPPF